MNTLDHSQSTQTSSSKEPRGLLKTVAAFRTRVGEGLKDQEITSLLKELATATESGFQFASYSEGFVTFSVPRQNLENWYPKVGWIVPKKEQSARAVATKYGLNLYEPIDDFISTTGEDMHHHLELVDNDDPMIILHPYFLKVRLFRKIDPCWFKPSRLQAISYGSDLLQDLAAFYSDNATAESDEDKSGPEPAHRMPR